MRLDLCALAIGLLIFTDSAVNWAQEKGTEAQAKPPAGSPDSTPAEKTAAKSTDEDIAAEFKRLNGAWRPKSGVLAGEKFPAEVCQQIKLELSNGRYKSSFNGEESSGTIELDLSKKPWAMDITVKDGSDAGKVIKCAYKFEDELLHVAYSLAFDDVRPTEFESNQDNKLLLIIYERSEDKSAESDSQPAAPAEIPRDK
jgi:uncharacterized protein (TIGR03067 family)